MLDPEKSVALDNSFDFLRDAPRIGYGRFHLRSWIINAASQCDVFPGEPGAIGGPMRDDRRSSRYRAVITDVNEFCRAYVSRQIGQTQEDVIPTGSKVDIVTLKTVDWGIVAKDKSLIGVRLRRIAEGELYSGQRF